VNHLKKERSKLQLIAFIIWLIIAAVLTVYVIINADMKLLLKTSRSLTKLLILVGIASFVGAIFEYKAWSRFASFIATPLIRFGKLPEVSGAAFVTAIFSNNAANTLVAGSYAEGNISRREMIISGLCNSYPAMISHSLRILFPLISAIGMAAVGYYSFTFGTGLLMTFAFLLISRIYSKKTAPFDFDIPEAAPTKIYSWHEVIKKSLKRTSSTILRLLYITAPIYLIVAFMAKNRMFDFWKDLVPESIQQWLTPEIMAVLAARLGGLVNAAGVAAEFLNQQQIAPWQIVLAFMVGNIITNPIRTLRRNLPAAMGIFPGKNGLWIVLILQSLRLAFAVLAIIVIIKWNS
jgi:hypothetical protein